MAVGDIRLTTTRYVRPDVYIGRVQQPRPSTLTGNPRFPAAVGRGNRLARTADSRHTRSRVEGETLNFSTLAPYIAPLDHNAANDQTLAAVKDGNNQPLSLGSWRFTESVTGSGEYDQVQIDATVFNTQTTYSVDYQSVDRDVLDPLEFDDVREIIFVGDSEGIPGYQEFVDYRIITTLTGDSTDTDALVTDANNTYINGSVTPASVTKNGATVAVNSNTDYIWSYNRQYVFTAQNPAGVSPNRTIEFKVAVTAQSGGNSQNTNLPWHTSETEPVLAIQEGVNDTNCAIDDNTNYKVGDKLPGWWENDGIKLDFTFGAGNFTATDTFTFTAAGPGLVEFSSAHQNSNQFSTVATPSAASANTSGGRITVNTETDYNDAFDREYLLAVTAAAGAAPNRTATVRWTAYNELPFSEGQITLTEATPPTLTMNLLERQIYLDFTFGTEHALADTTNAVTAAAATSLATAHTLAADIKAEYNNHDANTGGVWHTAGAGTHQVTAADSVDLATLRTLCLDLQAQYVAHLADTTMHVVADAIHALAYTVTASSDLATLVNFLNDLKTQYAAHRVSIGLEVDDYWTMRASADRREYTAKDDRDYDITVNTVNVGTSVQITYNAKTYEGSWGTLTLLASGGSYPDPFFDLPDNIRLMFRNIDTRYATGDKFTFSATSADLVDWTLVQRNTETITEGDIQQDVAGTITGVPLAWFIVLNETPTSILRVNESVSGTPLSYSWVTDTPYIYFSTDPGVDIQIDYEWRGAEPSPGNSYFITANRKRADIEFNEPIRYLTIDDAREGLYPSATTNHLWIAAEIMFETAFFGGYFIQVKSAADNEVYSIADYRNAIDATETKTEITDIIVLSYFDALGYAKNSVEQMNDPFEAKHRLLWVGTPIGTEVGDASTPGTLVYIARNTLQFSPNSQGKGTTILIANNEMTRTQALEDNTTTTLTLDGSYLAAHAAALTASFNDPAGTILNQSVAAFDEITLFTEREVQLLGDASTVYMNFRGTGVYEYGESITTDTTEVALNEISCRTLEHFVLRKVRQDLRPLVGLVPPNQSAGALIIQNQLVQTLGGLAAANIIARYGSDVDAPRPISPTQDVFVYVDNTDARNYNFGYYFITRKPIKRMLGLYSADTRFWDNRSTSGPG